MGEWQGIDTYRDEHGDYCVFNSEAEMIAHKERRKPNVRRFGLGARLEIAFNGEIRRQLLAGNISGGEIRSRFCGQADDYSVLSIRGDLDVKALMEALKSAANPEM